MTENRRPNRRDALQSLSSLAALPFLPRMACSATRSDGPKRPNILFIMSDDHAAHALSCYGSRINSTPNLDRLATEGMRFDNCFCTNSICAPSRAVILTGKYSHLNGVADNRLHFDGAQQTLPKLMRRAGYQTAMVGKWHLGSDPTGFDYWNVLPGQGDYQNPDMIENGVRKKNSGYVTDIITDAALGWLEKREEERPFFMMLHHKAPHADWIPDEKHAEMFNDAAIPQPQTFDDDYKTRTSQIDTHRLKVGTKQWELHFQKNLGDIPKGMSEQETREWVYQVYMKNYLRCIASVDDNIGRVLDYLDRTGLAENTVVVYTSDQGFFLGDHGLYDKRFMYEHSLRMPLLMRYPQEIAPGSTADAMVLNLDFASTCLGYADAPIPADLQGRNFREIARGRTPEAWREAMYYRFYEEAFGVGPHEGVRTERYKLIHYLYGDKGWELYDLENDPDEMRNLYGESNSAALVSQLKATMAELQKEYAVGEE